MTEENTIKEIKIPDHKAVSNFEGYRVRILSEEDFKLVQRLLFKLGYAWSDDMRTMNMLRHELLPLFIYTDHKAMIYFNTPIGMAEDDYCEVSSSRLAVIWRDKKYGITVV